MTLIADPSNCTVSVNVPTVFDNSAESISSCTLYHDKGPEPWLRKASTDAWLSNGIAEAIDGGDGSLHDQGDIYCVICYENGTLEIFDVPSFKCVFSVDKFMSGKTHLVDSCIREPSKDTQKFNKNISEDMPGQITKESGQNMKVVELSMHRWSGQFSRPFLFGILTDGTMLCYHAYLYEGQESTTKVEETNSAGLSTISTSRLRNLRFVRVSMDTFTQEESSSVSQSQRITLFKNVGGYHGLFLSGSRPAWFMVCRERLRVHPQVMNFCFQLEHFFFLNGNYISLKIAIQYKSNVLKSKQTKGKLQKKKGQRTKTKIIKDMIYPGLCPICNTQLLPLPKDPPVN